MTDGGKSADHRDRERPRVLITGVHGFIGRYLARDLSGAGYEVYGTSFGNEPESERVRHIDLSDCARLGGWVEEVQPHCVAHLAAISFVAHGQPNAIYEINLIGTRNLLAALSALPTPPRAVLLASSANVYGNQLAPSLDETTPPRPANDYAVSKLAMEHMASLWLDRLPIVIARPFNCIGVGQSPQFLLPKIVRHFKARAARIELGNIDVARDFLDVRVVAAAYRKLLETAPAGETFNICSGVATSISEILRLMAGLAGYAIEVEVNPEFVRKSEVIRLVGSPARLVARIGALDAVPLIDTLRWMFEAKE